MHVVARGRLAVYDAKGEYQIICDALEPLGLGARQAAFEADASWRQYDRPTPLDESNLAIDVLAGGVTRSLALDAHGKTLASAILDIDIDIDDEWPPR